MGIENGSCGAIVTRFLCRVLRPGNDDAEPVVLVQVLYEGALRPFRNVLTNLQTESPVLGAQLLVLREVCMANEALRTACCVVVVSTGMLHTRPAQRANVAAAARSELNYAACLTNECRDGQDKLLVQKVRVVGSRAPAPT